MIFWEKPRYISILVDNDSWILPYAERLVSDLLARGEKASLVRRAEDIPPNAIAFFLGCTKLVPSEILGRNSVSMVVHAGDLPKDRGFSPWTWAVLRGETTITVCLLHADVQADAGSVIFRDRIALRGTELVDEIRTLIGNKTIELAHRYLSQPLPEEGTSQVGAPTMVRKRTPADSELDLDKTVREQFQLLRVVDNEKYPAFFRIDGNKYLLKIYKVANDENS